MNIFEDDKDDPYKYTTDPQDFLCLNGDAKMHLSKEAALALADLLTEQGMYIEGVNAGLWHNPGYEERHEYGYFRFDRYKHMSVKENNDFVKNIITNECDNMNVFQIWRENHRQYRDAAGKDNSLP